MTLEKMIGARTVEGRYWSAPFAEISARSGDFFETAHPALPAAPAIAPKPAHTIGRSVSSTATNPRSSPISQPASAGPAGLGQVGSFDQLVRTRVVANTLSTATVIAAMSTATTMPHQKPARAPSRASPPTFADSIPAIRGTPSTTSKPKGLRKTSVGSKFVITLTTSQTAAEASPHTAPTRHDFADRS